MKLFNLLKNYQLNPAVPQQKLKLAHSQLIEKIGDIWTEIEDFLVPNCISYMQLLHRPAIVP